jgi:hypothetical protein
MSDEDPNAGKKLRKLAPRLILAWSKNRPVKESHREAVQRAVTEQWNEQTLTKQSETKLKKIAQELGPEEKRKLEEQTQKKKQDKTKGKDHGQSH